MVRSPGYPPAYGTLFLWDPVGMSDGSGYHVETVLFCLASCQRWFLDVSGRPLHSAKGRTRSAGTLGPLHGSSPGTLTLGP